MEVFPKQAEADVGNWVNVPYFGGEATNRWAWLNGGPATLDAFLDQAEGGRTTLEGLLALPLGGAPRAGVTDGDVVKADGKSRGRRVRGLLKRLSPGRADRYGAAGEDVEVAELGWWTVGAILFHELGDDGLSDFIEWSRQSARFDEHACRDKWKDYARIRGGDKRQLTLGTLVAMANEDDEDRQLALPDDLPAIGNLVQEATENPEVDPVVYRVDVEGAGTIQQLRYADVDSFPRFRGKVADQTHVRLPLVGSRAWDHLVKGLFDDVRVERVSEDAGPMGTFITYLTEFLGRARVGGNDPTELSRGHPYEDGKRVWFRLQDLHVFLLQQRFFTFNEKMVSHALRKLGGQNKQRKVEGQKLRVWSLPWPFGEVRTEPYVVPRTVQDPNKEI